MWEVTLFDNGLEVGTFDVSEQPRYNEYHAELMCTIIAVRRVDSTSCTMDVDIAW